MYKTTRLVMTFVVVALIVTLIVSAVNVGSWVLGPALGVTALVLGIYAQEIVQFGTNLALGLPSGAQPTHRK